jgi:hypothetical protein
MFLSSLKPNRAAAAGALAVGIAIAASSVGIVRAGIVNPDKSKTFTCSSGTACVTGNSTGSSTYGVYGESTGADGVHGVTKSTNGNSAVAGIASGTSGNAHGVYGRSANGDGVYGVTTKNDNSTSGVYGTAGNGWGLFGESSDTSGDYTAIAGVGDASATSLFVVVNTKTGGSCTIDPTANLACSGSVSGSAVHVRQRNSSGRHVLSYAAQSASATIEDVGTARMIDGVANVQISPDFASVTDRGWYYVFLTPLGDTRGLYVSVKTANAFQVRETLRGRNSLAFDYRIVAHPLGAPQDRLPAAPSRPAFARLIHPAL